ncbi:helix-turn-helix domain-containing protein [Streptococcus equi subsp. zooepidemicus]|uniref:helix-turn-helix domain-containing protein n=1 Tax=Streptococcus equi TaxID=1336 RepID=UPI00030FC081|nr:helix-turn-helix transcriptional regulator [Streptococcus equi]KIS06050.1 transcriptional regulator [Streptococcus equi subsp. zooepidemicus Sz16]KIS16471.1 transcriptional regulator [Streptococcus equi subsp. zooepidemicus SzAM35]MCD3399464.1 helix-turn-helix domain-containing protein [Streptococcus equi subsp. zooepidemicus]MCD3451287.1 helix-turn-helix domain-containing protein [Streptococcus equi subsp. zooepidemicus]MCD3465413.1 helix-turn-helix domain-containing protein [Streptococcus
MRYYKNIRQNKRLSQAIIGEVISRQSLISFEKGESTPHYETMMFLLRQIDMTFGEVEDSYTEIERVL